LKIKNQQGYVWYEKQQALNLGCIILMMLDFGKGYVEKSLAAGIFQCFSPCILYM